MSCPDKPFLLGEIQDRLVIRFVLGDNQQLVLLALGTTSVVHTCVVLLLQWQIKHGTEA